MSVISAKPANVSEAINAYQRGLSVRAAMTNDENQISFYRRENRPMVVGVISMLLIEANQTMNVQRTPSPIQITMIAEEVVENWWIFRLDEIAYALRQGAAGMYGTAYGKFDKQTVIEWLKTYDVEERLSQVEWVNAQQKKQIEEVEQDGDVLAGYQRLREVFEKTGKDALSLQDKERREQKLKAQWKDDGFRKWQAEYFAKKQQESEQNESSENL